MVIAKIQLRSFAEKCIDFFDAEKYVTVDAYLTATCRYLTLTPDATLPFTFPSQDCVQGLQEMQNGSLCGSEKKAPCRAACCDFKFSRWTHFDRLERMFFMIVMSIVINSETREQAADALEKLIQKLQREKLSNVSSQETPRTLITNHAVIAYSWCEE